MISIQHVDKTDFINDLRMSGPVRDWQIKCVCGGTNNSCNNGWMRGIENAANPIMTPLIRGDAALLSPADQTTIATWAVLKAMVVHHEFIPRKMRKKFATTRHPSPEWSVWIGR
jgi:hypothetical protein